MKNPRSEDVFKIANTFKQLSEKYKGHVVDMSEDTVPEKYELESTCGTLACHGGWYAVVNHERAHRLVSCMYPFVDYWVVIKKEYNRWKRRNGI